MVRGDRISATVLTKIARQITAYVTQDGVPKRRRVLPKVSHTFALTYLRYEGIGNDPRIATFRGQWIHLLKHGRNYSGYALSRPVGPRSTDWIVEGVFTSRVAGALSACLRKAQHLQLDGIARVLLAPEFQLHAMTVQRRSQLSVLIVNPEGPYRSAPRALSWREFTTELKTAKLVEGVLRR